MNELSVLLMVTLATVGPSNIRPPILARGGCNRAATCGGLGRSSCMVTKKVYHEPSAVTAKDGDVQVTGPDHVDVALTPEAAEETSNRLLEGSMKARGQRHLRNYPHRPK